ncbi:MAG: 2OG-Fe(II) oxygenase [Acidobacteria bacterium]|nr:2OG-Fe(II) oxygenase [Acidobacteriota bacterium]
MDNANSPISEKYKNLDLLINSELSTIKKDFPWTHFILDNFIETTSFKQFQKAIFSKQHTFSIQENDPHQIQFAVLEYIPLAKIFYSVEFKSILETLSNTKLTINTKNYVQLRHMDPDSPEFPPHIDDMGFRSVVTIYYLSPDWKEDFGGQLCLHKNKIGDEDQTVFINPIENRLVIFFSDDTNWHSIKKVYDWERYTILSEWLVKEKK